MLAGGGLARNSFLLAKCTATKERGYIRGTGSFGCNGDLSTVDRRASGFGYPANLARGD